MQTHVTDTPVAEWDDTISTTGRYLDVTVGSLTVSGDYPYPHDYCLAHRKACC